MTVQNRVYLLSFISLVWALIIWLILESDTIIFNDNLQSPDEIEAVTGSMCFPGMEQDE